MTPIQVARTASLENAYFGPIARTDVGIRTRLFSLELRSTATTDSSGLL